MENQPFALVIVAADEFWTATFAPLTGAFVFASVMVPDIIFVCEKMVSGKIKLKVSNNTRLLNLNSTREYCLVEQLFDITNNLNK